MSTNYTALADAVESARAKVDENGNDEPVLEAIAEAYYKTWRDNDAQHINRWALALIVVAAIRDAGFDVVAAPPVPADLDLS